MAAMDAFDFTGYDELVFAAMGSLPVPCLIYLPLQPMPKLARVVDSISISLNSPTAEKYQEVTRPQFANAFPALLEFAGMAKQAFAHTQLTVVDVLPEDDIEESKRLAEKIGIYLRIRKFS